MNDTAAKLRELARLHPPQQRTVAGARYGAAVGISDSKRRYQHQYYVDNKDAILATQQKNREVDKAQVARELKKARAR